MAIARDSDSAGAVVIFENDPRQATAYQELFDGAGWASEAALPNQDVQQLCEKRIRHTPSECSTARWASIDP
jgi:hypothetical protein